MKNQIKHEDESKKIAASAKKANLKSWLLVGLFLFVRFFFMEHFAIPSSSMTPTLITGDIIFIKKSQYAWSRLSIPFGGYLPFAKHGIRLHAPQRGDIVVFTLERDPAKYYVKRIVGIEGDYVQMKNAVLHINDQPCKMELVKNFTFVNDAGKTETGGMYRITLPNSTTSYTIYRNKPIGEGGIDNTLKFKVPKGHVWVQGDFNTDSADSFSTHFMGPIPNHWLVGRVFFVLMGSNSRTYTEQSWIKWVPQIPWRIFMWVKCFNLQRLFVITK